MNSTARKKSSGTFDSPRQYGIKAATAFSVVAAFLAISAFQAVPAAAKSEPDFEKKLEKGFHELQIGNTDKAIDQDFLIKGKQVSRIGSLPHRPGKSPEEKRKVIRSQGRVQKVHRSRS